MTIPEICRIINTGKFWVTSQDTVRSVLTTVWADFRQRATTMGQTASATKTDFERNLSTKQDLEIAASLLEEVVTS